MSTPKLTPWYPPSVKPARVGVYLTKENNRYIPNQWALVWDGEYWITQVTGVVVSNQDRQWRGLASNPNGEAS